MSGPHYTRDFLFVVKGPAADATDALAALRLIVQPCDEDEEKDDRFFIFQSNGATVE